MTEHNLELPDTRRPGRGIGSAEDHVAGATFAGVLLALAGLVDGIIMIFRRQEASCPNGKIFPQGTTDFTCYVHPQAGLGIAIAVLSIAMAILLVLSSITATSVLRGRSSAMQQDDAL